MFFANHPESFEINGQKGWSVLTGNTGGEWEYLLDKRETTYGTGVLSEDNHRYAAVKVNGIAGLLLFPDEFSWPSEAEDEPQTFNTNSDNWNGRNYTVSQFEALQASGCVFLPGAGIRDIPIGTGDSAQVTGAGTEGYYWSATPSRLMSFIYYKVCSTRSMSISQGFSVRLVTDIN